MGVKASWLSRRASGTNTDPVQIGDLVDPASDRFVGQLRGYRRVQSGFDVS